MNAFDLMDEFAHWSPEAEGGVIGGLLVGGAQAFDSVADLLTPGDFFSPVNAAAFTAVQTLVMTGKEVDLVAAHSEMQRTGNGTDLQSLHELTLHYVTPRLLRQHAETVAEQSASRSLQRAASDVRDIAEDVAVPVADRLTQSMARLEKVQQAKGKSEPQKAEAFVAGFLDRLQAMADGTVQPGIPTHIPALDSMFGGGLKGGKQVIVAARPSVGKSSFAQQLCINLAMQGHAAAMFSMEMGCAELTDRAVANLGRVALDGIATGRLDEGQWSRVVESVEKMRDLPLFFDEQPAMSLGDIVSKARSLKRKHNLKLLAIDYLQLCSSGKQGDSRHHQIEEISRGLKSLAKQLDITIVTLSQLNREVEKRTNARPVLSDLKESGAIEEDADAVLMLWRHQVGPNANVIGCAVPKNRQGRVGEFALHFEGAFQRWTESTESLSAPARAESSSRYAKGEF